MAKVNLKHSGAVIDQQIDRVKDGSVVVENTLSALDLESKKPVDSEGIASAIEAASNSLKARGYIYMGVATPATTPDVSGGKVFYLAAQAGEYANFGYTLPTDALTSLEWNGERWFAVRIADLVTAEEVEQIILDNTASEVTADGVTPVSGQAVSNALAHKVSVDKSLFENNMTSEAERFETSGFVITSGSYGAANAKYKLPSDVFNCTAGICHIAFEFKINEDVNVDGGDKTFFSVVSKFHNIDFALRTGATQVFEGSELKAGSSVVARSGIPLFTSCFGVNSSWTVSGGDYLRWWMSPRSLQFDDNNKSSNYKPLCGKDLFSIQIVAVDAEGVEIEDTLSTTAQDAYSQWIDAYIEVTDSGINIVNESLSLSKIYSFTTYTSFNALLTSIYNDLHDKVFGNCKIKVRELNASYYSRRGKSVSDITKCKIYLGTTHPNNSGGQFYDGFPCYISYAIDEEWHTFELLMDKFNDRMMYAVDGQYIGSSQGTNLLISNIRYPFRNAELQFGGDLNCTIRNVLVESNNYSRASFSDMSDGTVHYITSKYNPHIINFFIHDLYPTIDRGEAQLNTSYFKYVKNGGYIPDRFEGAQGYRGDDAITSDRVNLAFPAFSVSQVLAKLEERGYMRIKKEQVRDILNGVVLNPTHKYYIIDSDDHATYIYDQSELRSIFTRSGVDFALELGFYVDGEIPTEIAGYDAASFVQTVCKDTDEHRRELQSRIHSLMASGWAMHIHGSKEGYVFQGKTYNEMLAEVRAALNICKHYGWATNTWCFAGNYYTPNSIKLIEAEGLMFGTTTETQPIAKCRSMFALPRKQIETILKNNMKYIL